MATFKLIRPDKDIREPGDLRARLLTTVLALTTSLILAMLGVPTSLVGVGALVSVFAWYRWVRSKFSDWPRTQDVIGELVIEPTKLIRYGKNGALASHSLETITAVHLHYNYVKGLAYAYRGPVSSGVSELILHHRDGSRHSLKFLIEQKGQLPALEAFLRSHYRSGITVREQYGRDGLAMMLLRCDRSFKEIQALKKELGLESSP
jgi:hypothetical protein